MNKMPCSITDDVMSDPEYGASTEMTELDVIDQRLSHMVKEIDLTISSLKKAQTELRLALIELDDLAER
jgi:hypothetical protein